VTLSYGRGPLSPRPAGRFSKPVPADLVYVEPIPRRIRAMLDGRTVVDTEQAVHVHRAGRPKGYALPAEAVEGLPTSPEPDVPGYVVVPWDAVDAWYEEEQQVSGYPRNAYHRVDIMATSRHLRVLVGDVVLVDTTDTMGVYETALTPKLYVHPDAVRTDLLQPSETTTFCAYKGHTTYFHAVVDGEVFEDVAWCYPDPFDESLRLGGLLSFEPEHATVITDLPEF
jgi:uncharacterized protein (DUF427 family)